MFLKATHIGGCSLKKKKKHRKTTHLFLDPNSTPPKKNNELLVHPEVFQPQYEKSVKKIIPQNHPPPTHDFCGFKNGGNFEKIQKNLGQRLYVQLSSQAARLHHGRGYLSNLTTTLRGNDLHRCLGMGCFWKWTKKKRVRDGALACLVVNN